MRYYPALFILVVYRLCAIGHESLWILS